MSYNLYTADGHFITRTKRYPCNFNGLIVDSHGDKHWLLDGISHRTDGPAIEFVGGAKAWYKKGILHNLNGHAFEYHDGHKEYWIYDKRITEEQHKLLRDIMKLKGLLI